MGMNHSPLSPASPHFDFSSTIPPNNVSSPAPNLLQQKRPSSLNLDLPNSKFDHSPAFSGELHSTFACEDSSEDTPRSEGSAGLGSGYASTLEEAPNSKNGQQRRRKLGGGGERGINKSEHTIYKGVRKRNGDRWVSEIREPGTKNRIWLGTFSIPEMAARAYDVAAFNLKTPYAYLNFPEHVSSLPISPSRSPKDIQEAAAAAAALRGLASSSHIGRTGGLVATPTLHVDETSTSSSTEQQMQSTNMETKSSSLIDEDMIFDMPNVLADMAEGLMITPPLHYLATATNSDNNTVCDHEDSTHSSIWNL